MIIVRLPKHIRSWVDLAEWQYATQSSSDTLKTKDMAEWIDPSNETCLDGWTHSGEKSKLGKWLNGNILLLKQRPLSRTCSAQASSKILDRDVGCSLQPCCLSFNTTINFAQITDSHLSKEKFPRHMTFYNTGNSFGSEFEHGRNPPPPPDGLKNLMFQNFNLAIFRFPPPSQDIGPLLPWPILPLPPRSPALKVGRGEGRICGSLQQWWG